MEVKLTDADMESISRQVAQTLEEKVMARLMGSAAWETMHKRAEKIAENYMNANMVQIEAADVFRKVLLAEGQKLLTQIVVKGVRDALGADAGLREQVNRVIIDEAVAAAHRLAEELEAGRCN